MKNDWAKKNYEKVILIVGAVLALLLAGWLIFDTMGFAEKFQSGSASRSKEIDKTTIEAVKSASQLVGKAAQWSGENLFVSGMAIEEPQGVGQPPILKEIKDIGVTNFHAPLSNDWIRRYSPPLDISRIDLKTLDPDQDGFNNKEEFLYGTVPNDPSSRPPLVAKLCLVEEVASNVQIAFKSKVDQRNYQINVTVDGALDSRFVPTGGSFGPKDYQFKLLGYHEKITRDSQGVPVDESTVDISYYQPGEKKTYKDTLVKGADWSLPTLTAKFRDQLTGQEPLVRRNEFVNLGEGAERESYRLETISADSATIVDIKTNKKLTITKCE